MGDGERNLKKNLNLTTPAILTGEKKAPPQQKFFIKELLHPRRSGPGIEMRGGGEMVREGNPHIVYMCVGWVGKVNCRP